jgi:hypothetical protein
MVGVLLNWVAAHGQACVTVKLFCTVVGIAEAVKDTVQFPWLENDCMVTVYEGAADAAGTEMD